MLYLYSKCCIFVAVDSAFYSTKNTAFAKF